ncbi:16S rRNA (cytosine(1402)-N(4))-methyltransferase, partial [Rhizobiaceae sp. 2RAB30]
MMAGHGSDPETAGGPARHIPVLLDEVLAALEPLDGAVIVDGTFGAGGYTRALIARGANVVAIDRDPDAIAAGRALEAGAGGKLRLGMRIGRRHVNPHDTCHGGVLASFADMQLYVSQQQEPSLRYILMPTINMSIDYI